MLLALDIGNTNVTMGIFHEKSLKATWRIATDASKLTDEYRLTFTQLLLQSDISPKDVNSVAICSVVPPLTPTFVHLCQTLFGVSPLVVGAGTKTGIKILYDSPHDVGADRIVDATAAINLYGGPTIIVDVGTFTVFDAISEKGDYLGGAISLGISVAADTIYHASSQLRRVDLNSPPKAIGKNTVHSIQSGLVFGFSDMVTGMVKRFREEMGTTSTVVATGGLAAIINKEITIFDEVNPDLTLIGLRLIHEMNTNDVTL